MTIKDIKAFARLVCDWCLEQDDLRGFDVWICGPPHRPAVQVMLEWPNDLRTCRVYAVVDVRILEIDQQLLNSTLDFVAEQARRQAARIADPNRLPG